MRDLDELLSGDIARAAGDSARPPHFDALAVRGRRRATWRRTAVAGGAALTVVAVVGAAQLVGGSRPSSDPAPVAPDSSQVDRLGDLGWEMPDQDAQQEAAAVIEDPAANVVSGVVDPADPRSRLVVWQTCNDPCDDLRTAVAVTDDGFVTRTSLPLEDLGTVVSGGAGVFVADNLQPGEPPLLISARGTADLRMDAAESPLQEGEVLVPLHGSGVPIVGLVAVDPTTGTGHAIPTPGRDIQGWSQLGDVLTVKIGADNLRRSEDGGSNWTTATVPETGREFTWLVPSADRSVSGVLVGGDGATYPSLESAVRMPDRSDPAAFPHESAPWAYFSAAYVLPDGRLLVAVNGWSDESEHAEGERGEEVTPSGLYATNGEDWSSLTPLGALAGQAPVASFTTSTDGTPSLVATAIGGDELVFSADGDSWKTLPAR